MKIAASHFVSLLHRTFYNNMKCQTVGNNYCIITSSFLTLTSKKPYRRHIYSAHPSFLYSFLEVPDIAPSGLSSSSSESGLGLVGILSLLVTLFSILVAVSSGSSSIPGGSSEKWSGERERFSHRILSSQTRKVLGSSLIDFRIPLDFAKVASILA
jgi:hypothetical protein